MGGSETPQSEVTLLDAKGRTHVDALYVISIVCASRVSVSNTLWLMCLRAQLTSGRGDGGEQGGGGPAQPQEGASRALPSLIQDSELLLGEKLGSGSFGVVRKGEWHTPTGRVVREVFFPFCKDVTCSPLSVSSYPASLKRG